MEGQELLPPASDPEPKKPDGRGGKRANQHGRNPARYRDTRKVTKLLNDGDATPIEVLINNMRFYWYRADALSARLEEAEELFLQLTPQKMMELIAKGPEADAELKLLNERIAKLNDLMAKVQKYRDKAQQCAVDAAPYCHPRLSALAVKVQSSGDSTKPEMLDVTPETTARDAVEHYADYLRRQREAAGSPAIDSQL